MKIKVQKSVVQGEISVPGSKSHTIRAILLALMATGVSTIKNPLVSEDTISCLYAALKLGAELSEIYEDQVLIWKIKGTGGKLTNKTDEIIDLGNSGTSLRLLAGMAATGSLKICFDGDHSLRGRPMGSLISALEKLGVTVGTSEEGKCPLTVRGPITGSETTVNGKSSQFVTSLLFATPLAEQDTKINIVNLNERPYIDVTLDWLDFMGIKYSFEEDYSSFTVKGKQKYKAYTRTMPADFSTATFALGAAAITKGKLIIKNLDFNDKQGDKEIFDHLKRMGMRVRKNNNNVVVYRNVELNGDMEFDLNATPDALPAMAAIACYATGKTILGNVIHARMKETDRIVAMAEELTKMGAKISEIQDGLVVHKSELHGAVVNGHNDHRIIMALVIAALGATGETTIENARAVSVTYPDFVKDFQKIHADIQKA